MAVVHAVASQLGFASFDALLTAPADEEALVVVDNCEHVIDQAADAIAAILDTYDRPRVLATSRSPLGAPDESIIALAPLGLPLRGQDGHDCDAVRLVVERVRDAGGPTDAASDPAIVELCRQLDGLPLALELAAGLTRLMRPAEIVDRLAEGLEVLARPRFRGDQRHRSLTATIEWSVRLLRPDVDALLLRLSLVPGPFPDRLAQALAADVGITKSEAADALAQLVESSLVAVDAAGDATRYRVFETVRSYAVHHLREVGQLEEARRELADRVVRAVSELLAEGARRWDRRTFARLDALYDAMAATLRWCIDDDDDPVRAMVLSSALWAVVHQGHTEEIAALTGAVLDRWPDPTLPHAADAAATNATARYLLGDRDGAVAVAEGALPWADGGVAAPATLRRAIGHAISAGGDNGRALEMLDDAAGIARERGLLGMALELDVSRAQLVACTDVAAGRELAAAAGREAAALGSVVNEVWAGTIEAALALQQDPASGRALVEEALAAARRLDYTSAMATGLRSVAWASTCDGGHRAAATALLELLDHLLGRGGIADLRGALASTADLLAATGDPRWMTLWATSRSLPAGGLSGCGLPPLVPALAAEEAPVVGRREAVVLTRTALRDLLDNSRPTPPVAATPPSVWRFEVRGPIVHLELGGREAEVRSSKGMFDLARLLAVPGREIHCIELVGGGVEQASTGEVIDEAARRSYEARIRELQDDLDEADARHDLGRSEQVAAELDALVAHLAASLGVGGRTRTVAGNAERARSAVTQRIRSTIRRLHREHPEIARHLDAAIRTGTFCSYQPEHPVDWSL